MDEAGSPVSVAHAVKVHANANPEVHSSARFVRRDVQAQLLRMPDAKKSRDTRFTKGIYRQFWERE